MLSAKPDAMLRAPQVSPEQQLGVSLAVAEIAGEGNMAVSRAHTLICRDPLTPALSPFQGEREKKGGHSVKIPSPPTEVGEKEGEGS
jgi:hypothetical protein